MTAGIWAAVDRLTHPSVVQVERAADADWLTELADSRSSCSVPAYRAATTRYATIPSLWDQSTAALFSGGEVGSGGGAKPLRERSLADLDLMEIRSIIRDTTRHELADRGVKPAKDEIGMPVDFEQGEIRRLASLVAQETADGWWWEYRFASWGRLLETYLQLREHAPKPTRLRNTACPLCKTRQLTVEQDGELMVVPPLVVDFRDGYVRAARCEACSATWFRGQELLELAALVGGDPTVQMTA